MKISDLRQMVYAELREDVPPSYYNSAMWSSVDVDRAIEEGLETALKDSKVLVSKKTLPIADDIHLDFDEIIMILAAKYNDRLLKIRDIITMNYELPEWDVDNTHDEPKYLTISAKTDFISSNPEVIINVYPKPSSGNIHLYYIPRVSFYEGSNEIELKFSLRFFRAIVYYAVSTLLRKVLSNESFQESEYYMGLYKQLINSETLPTKFNLPVKINSMGEKA